MNKFVTLVFLFTLVCFTNSEIENDTGVTRDSRSLLPGLEDGPGNGGDNLEIPDEGDAGKRRRRRKRRRKGGNGKGGKPSRAPTSAPTCDQSFDLLFLIDTSASMYHNDDIVDEINYTIAMLNNHDGYVDRVAVAKFDNNVNVSQWFMNPADALDYLVKMKDHNPEWGFTNIAYAIQQVSEFIHDTSSSKPLFVVLLSDGNTIRSTGTGCVFRPERCATIALVDMLGYNQNVEFVYVGVGDNPSRRIFSKYFHNFDEKINLEVRC